MTTSPEYKALEARVATLEAQIAAQGAVIAQLSQLPAGIASLARQMMILHEWTEGLDARMGRLESKVDSMAVDLGEVKGDVAMALTILRRWDAERG